MKVFELLSSSEKWTKGTYARNKHGTRVSPMSPGAIRFCVLGAIESVCGKDSFRFTEIVTQVTSAIWNQTKGKYNSIAVWNDRKSCRWSHVFKLLKKLDV